MSHSPLGRFRAGAIPVVVLLVLLLVTLHLMSSAVQNTEELSRMFIPLLLFTLFGVMVLAGLVVINIVALTKRYRSREAGSRLTLRMVVIFVTLAFVPVAVVYFYSQQFLMHGIDNWFDVRIDKAMEDALDLSKASLDLHRKEKLRATKRVLAELDEVSVVGMTIGLEEMRDRYGASELTLIDNKSFVVIASSNVDPSVLVPDVPDMSILQQVLDGGDFIGLTPQGELSQLYMRVVITDPIRPRILQALYPTSDTISGLSEEVQQAYNHYKELAYLRESIKNTFTMTLILVLLFSLLSAIWAAFFTARRLVAPVADIAKGTKAVADGDYSGQIPVPEHRDEISTLVTSFNAMTQRIAQARDLAESSQRQVESQRTYLETVLGNLSSGVITFDTDGSLRTANHAASLILQVDLDNMQGKGLDVLAECSDKMQQFVDLLREPLSEKGMEWHSEIILYGNEGRQVLHCHSTPLAGLGGDKGGHVLVFDDITTLIKAQRDSAWGEVARRLAHEIKNPLTPIQLAAERLRHKYLRKMDEKDAEVLDRSTHTIVQQVEAMKEMVNAFSDYARPSQMTPEPLILDDLVGDILELYRDAVAEIEMGSDLASDGVKIEADPVRIRQVVHNLVKNAQEAVMENGGGRILVTTRQLFAADCRFVEFQVCDNGPGFNADNMANLFEPYVTTKAKGTGLGLAIVKKIIEEHGGMIWAENLGEGGGRVAFRLPIMVSNQEPDSSQAVQETNASLNKEAIARNKK